MLENLRQRIEKTIKELPNNMEITSIENSIEYSIMTPSSHNTIKITEENSGDITLEMTTDNLIVVDTKEEKAKATLNRNIELANRYKCKLDVSDIDTHYVECTRKKIVKKDQIGQIEKHIRDLDSELTNIIDKF